MKKHRKFQFHNALPPYFGGKRKLCPWIFGKLQATIPSNQWGNLTFIDAFLGGGAVSLFAKAQGFRHIIVNDWSYRSSLIARGILANQRQHIRREDLLYISQAVPKESSPGFVTTTYCPTVFSSRHAQALDQWLYWIRKIEDPTRQALLLLLIWHAAGEFVCFGSSLGPSNRPFAEALDGQRSWDDINPKRFSDRSLHSLLTPVFRVLEKKQQAINKGIFGGSTVTCHQQDVFEFLTHVQGDIIYFDPPYAGTLGYEKSNRVLDAILTGQQAQAEPSSFSKETDILSRIILTGQQAQAEPSSFSKETDILSRMLKAARHIPVWILSYGNQHLDLEALKTRVQSADPNRTVYAFSRQYTHLVHVSKNTDNRELLVIAVSEA